MVDCVLLKDFYHLLQARDLGFDDVVGRMTAKGSSPTRSRAMENGVVPAPWPPSVERTQCRAICDICRVMASSSVLPPSLLQQLLQLKTDVEMVFDLRLVSAGNDDDLFATCGDCLFHAVLDKRLVYQCQHLFRQRLGGRQKACAEAGQPEKLLCALCLSSFAILHAG